LRKDIAAKRLHQRLLPNSLVSTRQSHLNSLSLANTSTSSEPTVFENYVHDIFIDNTHVELSLWDTAGQEEFDRLRSLSYDDTHAIMLCFSVDSPDSLENVESKWVGEIAENCPGVKLVLVALKCDLREQEKDDREDGREPKKPTIDYKQGLAVAEKVKALRYLGMLWHACEQRVSRAFESSRTNTYCRMLGDEEPRRQRGFHRSRPRRPHGQERQRRQRQLLMLRHVKLAQRYSSSHGMRPTIANSLLLYRHKHIPPTLSRRIIHHTASASFFSFL
jgi:Rho family protein